MHGSGRPIGRSGRRRGRPWRRETRASAVHANAVRARVAFVALFRDSHSPASRAPLFRELFSPMEKGPSRSRRGRAPGKRRRRRGLGGPRRRCVVSVPVSWGAGRGPPRRRQVPSCQWRSHIRDTHRAKLAATVTNSSKQCYCCYKTRSNKMLRPRPQPW